jgi:spermidine synthase
MAEAPSFVHNNWFTEKSDGIGFSIKIKEKIFEKQSQFQKIEIYDTETLGRLLLLDGKTMVSDKDEHIYHEMITHIPLNTHPNPKRALVIGGGDGGTIREIIKHPSIEEAYLVEIDEDVINACKEYFPEVSCALDDPRVTVCCEDGIQFIKDHKNYFDLIVIDSTDPEGFALELFSPSFYQNVYDALTDDGIMTNQTDNPFIYPDTVRTTYQNMGKVFQNIYMYWGYCMLYPGSFWTFGFGSKTYNPLLEVSIEKIKAKNLKTKYYNAGLQKGAFLLPQFALDILPDHAPQKRV